VDVPGLTDTQRELVEAVSRASSAVAAVRTAWVFGSRIHGQPRADSDLDVGVVYARTLTSRERELARRELLQRLTDELGKLGEWADVVDLDRAASIVGFNALKYGALALERDADERIDWVVRAIRKYQDDAPYRALFHEAAFGPRGHRA
jgi:predicted nucleotidyltransferase